MRKAPFVDRRAVDVRRTPIPRRRTCVLAEVNPPPSRSAVTLRSARSDALERPSPPRARSRTTGADEDSETTQWSLARRWAYRAIIVLAALSAIVMLWWPIGFDQGDFATNGDILVRGGEPYRDASG